MNRIDASERELARYGEPLLETLLFDRTTRRNIVWGTRDYEHFGEAYQARFPMTAELITGEKGARIRSRIHKEQSCQTTRTKDKAEVFTPSWMCNEQNNLIDKSWFGREDVFNTQGYKSWKAREAPIVFEDKPRRRWQDYVDARCLEMACGEAPYLVSRYDTVTGAPIGITQRIGLLDRKLRVVCENAEGEEEWMKWAIRAFQSVYGFEFQGDSLFLARENLLDTFGDYLRFQFDREPSFQELKTIARIISWNLWQMDGIELTVPFQTISEQFHQLTLGEAQGTEKPKPCYCKIRDWRWKVTAVYEAQAQKREEASAESWKMKWRAVVGNPPFQEADGGAGASSAPIYPYFVENAKALAPGCISLIVPARWFTGGKHLDGFRKRMLEDEHIRELHDFLHPEEIFPNTNNRGGICCFLWEKGYHNQEAPQVRVVTHEGGGQVRETWRSLKTRDLAIFIRNADAVRILDKVIPVGTKKEDTLGYYVSARKPFNIESNIVKTPEWHLEKEEASLIACYGKRRQLGYIRESLVTKNEDLIRQWKVFTPRANNIGTELKDDNLNTFLGEPGTVCTEAYLAIGGGLSLDRERAENLRTFLKTKLARYMHALAKASHDATQITYRFVPLVDLSEVWTDEKLYEKYGLTEEEIRLIESSVKPMGQRL